MLCTEHLIYLSLNHKIYNEVKQNLKRVGRNTTITLGAGNRLRSQRNRKGGSVDSVGTWKEGHPLGWWNIPCHHHISPSISKSGAINQIRTWFQACSRILRGRNMPTYNWVLVLASQDEHAWHPAAYFIFAASVNKPIFSCKRGTIPTIQVRTCQVWRVAEIANQSLS